MPVPEPPLHRPRRLRRSPAVRALVRETRLTADDLIAPLFVREGDGPAEPVGSMPGVLRHSIPQLVEECRGLAALGVHAVALFPCTPAALKTPDGREALNPENLLNRAVRAVKAALPDLVVITDVALDPYTSHGHDGLLDARGDVDNDATVAVLAKMAVLQARAGSDWVAPSDMMDGRVRAIRAALDAAGCAETTILSYAAKFASAFYGPFRDAVGSQSAAAGGSYLDKRTYQLDPANAREAVADALLDEAEGADLLMVKPAGPYLDVIAALRAATRRPVAAYQVSGEYAQLHAAAGRGWLNLEQARDESLLAIKRAGADLILTYFAGEVAGDLARGKA